MADGQGTSEATYLVVNIDDGFLNLMTPDGVPKDDVRVPEGQLGRDITDGFASGADIIVTVRSENSDETVLGFKEQGQE